MTDLVSLAGQHKDLSEKAQKKAGQAAGSDMAQKHKTFIADLIGMLDRKEIVSSAPESFLNKKEYAALSEQGRSAVDFALLNLASQLRLIEDFYRSKATPNASPELQTMIEYFWDMKSRLETKHGDVLKF